MDQNTIKANLPHTINLKGKPAVSQTRSEEYTRHLLILGSLLPSTLHLLHCASV
jgi:hypothetical protein